MRPPAGDAPPLARRVAVGLAAGTVVSSALVQLESYALFARSGGIAADVAFALAFPFLQLDALVLGLCFGTAYLLVAGRFRVAVVGAVFLAIAWTIVNQIAFGVLRHNVSVFDPDVARGSLLADLPLLAGSVPAATIWLAALNVLIMVAGALLVRRWVQLGNGDAHFGRVRRTALLCMGYVAASILAPRLVDTHGLERHAVVALLTPVRTNGALHSSDSSIPDSLLLRPAFATFRPDSSASRLIEAVARARSLRRPNVLLVVLESVGADQLFPGDAPNARLTPNIARLARSGVLFRNIYAVNPATTFAHLPMMTGGPVITWGDATEYFKHPYIGPTLPGTLRSMGYRTGLFAATDLSFAALDRFYAHLPWDTLLHYGKGDGPLKASERVHAWGVNEGHLWAHARRWVEAERTPFFLDFQSISTHYPYGMPPEFVGPVAATDARSRYFNAVAYTDSVLGRMLADLAARGELDRTIVVITGDHGEAFADKHPQNVTHRNYVYDENMRSFLLFSIPGLPGPIASARLGTHADMVPSLLGLLGGTIAASGQDLFAEGFAPRMVYFHKDVPPGLWGLRDGQWKYIDRTIGGAPELYDLDRDPDERTNLAALHGSMTARYRVLVNEWYARANLTFLSQLRGLGATGQRAARETLRRGLRDIRIGVASRADADDFTTLTVVPRDARPMVNVRWHWLDKETTVRVRVVSPSRQFWVYPVVVEYPWSSFLVNATPRATLEAGRWTVDVWAGAHKLGRTTFEVP